MFKKMLLMVSALVLVATFGTANVFAKETPVEETSTVSSQDCLPLFDTAYYCDGRLNAFDIMQSVAVYYEYTSVQHWDADGNEYWTDEVSAIEVWVVGSDSVGQLALLVPASKFAPAFSATKDVQIASAQGVTLNYSPSSDAFWVTGPDGYTFVWDAD